MEKKIGRPPINANLAILDVAARRGITQAEAARSLGMSLATFKNRLKDDPTFAAAWKEGLERCKAEIQAAIASMPSGRSDIVPIAKIPAKHRPLSVVMTRELARRIQLLADARGLTRNRIIVDAAEAYLAQAEVLSQAA